LIEPKPRKTATTRCVNARQGRGKKRSQTPKKERIQERGEKQLACLTPLDPKEKEKERRMGTTSMGFEEAGLK